MHSSPGGSARRLVTRAEHWNTSPEERDAGFPWDALDDGAHRVLTRAVDVRAPVTTTFRWICQLRHAPYSYDWIDNGGRRSPRTLTPGAERLATGQRFLIGTIADVDAGRSVTLRALPQARRLYGLLACSYQVVPVTDAASRIVVRLVVAEPAGALQQARYAVLVWGDLVMMRKQLLTLRDLAEADHRATG